MVSKVERNLFSLLRLAFGTSAEAIELSSLSREEWQKLVDLSFQQGAAAIAVDGLQRMYESCPNLELELDKPEYEGLKYEWFGSVFQVEENYKTHKRALRKLTDLFGSQGIRVLLLKGLGVGRYYPTPSHRQCGDLDIYLFGDYEKGNKIIESLGIEINRENSKHSVFTFNSVMVENHKSFLDLDVTSAERKNNEIISSTVSEGVDSGEGYVLPDSLTNYLFLIRHIAKHFCESGGITIRHLLDWGLFLQGERETLDVQKGNELIERMGLTQIKDIFTRLSAYVTGFDLSFALFRHNQSLEFQSVDEKFLDEILKEKVTVLSSNPIVRSIQIVKAWNAHRWKYRYFPDNFSESFWNRFCHLAVFKVQSFFKGDKVIRN